MNTVQNYAKQATLPNGPLTPKSVVETLFADFCHVYPSAPETWYFWFQAATYKVLSDFFELGETEAEYILRGGEFCLFVCNLLRESLPAQLARLNR